MHVLLSSCRHICQRVVSQTAQLSLGLFRKAGEWQKCEISCENAAKMQSIGAPMGVTAEILLELEQFVDDYGVTGRTRPPISKADFIEVAKELIADRQLSKASVGVFEKIFDAVYTNRM
jgi:hypothetical protein